MNQDLLSAPTSGIATQRSGANVDTSESAFRRATRATVIQRDSALEEKQICNAMIRGMAALADSIPDAQFVAVDSDFNILGCSARWAASTGFQAASLVGRPLDGFEQSVVADERRAILRSVLERRVATIVRSIRHGKFEMAAMSPIELGGRCLGATWLTQPGTGCAPAAECASVVYPTHHQWGSIGQATNRQLDVLRLLGRSLDNASIAQILKNGKRTVEWHVSVLMTELGAADRAELVRLSSCAGLPSFPDDAWSRMIRARDRGTGVQRRTRSRAGAQVNET